MGSQWFNRIGIVAMLIGVAWFLKFAFDNHWVGPAGRVLIGLVSGAALIAWSERFRSKGYLAFSYSLKAVGSGVLYLSLWAAFSMYHLIPPGVAFAGMVLVTAFNAFIAWRQSAELLAVYAIVGAFSTPLLLSTGRNEEVFLFSYLLMMNAATMALLVLKGWNRLLVLSFLGTVAFYWGWYWQFYAPAAFVKDGVLPGAVCAAVCGGDHSGAAETRARGAGRCGARADQPGERGLRLPGLLRDAVAERERTEYGAGVVLRGLRRVLPGRAQIDGAHAGCGDAAGVALRYSAFDRDRLPDLAVPLAVHGHWVTVGWMAEGTVLVWVATRMRTDLMQALAAGALTLGLISLAMDATIAQTRVLWNTRLLSFAVSIAAMAISTVLIRGEANREGSREGSARTSRGTLATARTGRRGDDACAGDGRRAAGDPYLLVVERGTGGRHAGSAGSRFAAEQRHLDDGGKRSYRLGGCTPQSRSVHSKRRSIESKPPAGLRLDC